MTESNAVHCVRVPKSSEEGSKLLKESVPKSTVSSFLYLHFMLCTSLDIQ